MSLITLVDQLAHLQAPYHAYTWNGWQIRPIPSGNNLLFLASRDDENVVVKFLIRDARQRAAREWNALTLLERLGIPLGPRPLYCDLERAPHAVVIQTWLDGDSIHTPRTDDRLWLRIVQTYAMLHQVPLTDIQRHGIVLPETGSTWPVKQAAAALRTFAQQIPASPYADALAHLLQTLEQIQFPALRSTRCWCHGDPNIRNLLLTARGVNMVDWEYSGYSDPAEEIAMLMTHPFAFQTGDLHWHRVAEYYGQLVGETDMQQRIYLQYAVRLAWWCVRLLVGYYVLLRQPTHRLVGTSAEAEISTLDNIDRYFARAHTWLARFA